WNVWFLVALCSAAVTRSLLSNNDGCVIARISDERSFYPLAREGQMLPSSAASLIATTGYGRVGMWRGGLRSTMSVAAPFVWRCLSGSAVTPFPHPAHRTQQADFPHCALGQDLTPSPTTGRGRAGSDVRARSTRRGAREWIAPALASPDLVLES